MKRWNAREERGEAVGWVQAAKRVEVEVKVENKTQIASSFFLNPTLVLFFFFLLKPQPPPHGPDRAPGGARPPAERSAARCVIQRAGGGGGRTRRKKGMRFVVPAGEREKRPCRRFSCPPFASPFTFFYASSALSLAFLRHPRRLFDVELSG